MRCQVCQYDLPAGVTFCPNCGTPVSQPLAPTQLASSPQQEIPPTVAASEPPPYGYQPPSNYGAPPPPPPPAAYDPNYPPASQPYGGTPSGAYPPPSYAPPPPQPYAPAYVPAPQPAKKSNGCVIALIVVLVIFVVVGGGIAAATVFVFHKVGSTVSNAEATANADLSAIPTVPTLTLPTVTVPGNSGSAPTSSQIDPTAAKIITSAQTSSGVDSNGNPTDNQTNFTVGDDVYVSFDSTGQAGYVELTLYRDGNYDIKSDPLQLTDGEPGGYFPITVNNPGQFVAALYWCNQSDCSDAALGQLVNFTVTQ